MIFRENMVLSMEIPGYIYCEHQSIMVGSGSLGERPKMIFAYCIDPSQVIRLGYH
jgi:hypothetical protein